MIRATLTSRNDVVNVGGLYRNGVAAQVALGRLAHRSELVINPRLPVRVWTRRLAEHGDGIALTYCRTETGAFFPWVWDFAHGLLFLKGRLTFYQTNGKPMVQKKGKNAGKVATAGAPSVLIAYGARNIDALARCGLDGKLVRLK